MCELPLLPRTRLRVLRGSAVVCTSPSSSCSVDTRNTPIDTERRCQASVLTGRTPQRSCIDTAEGCGQKPAWSCYDKMPFPPTEFTGDPRPLLFLTVTGSYCLCLRMHLASWLIQLCVSCSVSHALSFCLALPRNASHPLSTSLFEAANC